MAFRSLAFRSDDDLLNCYECHPIGPDTDEDLKEYLLSPLKEELRKRGILT